MEMAFFKSNLSRGGNWNNLVNNNSEKMEKKEM